MDLAIKIIWIILALLILYTVYVSVNKIVKVVNSKNLLMRDIEMFKMKFSEEEILNHLDFIITECLDYYVAMTLTPKGLYYINTQLETEITNNLGEIVSARISPTLYSQLTLIYDPSQISNVIGEKIYTKVLEYVVQFNVQNGKDKK